MSSDKCKVCNHLRVDEINRQLLGIDPNLGVIAQKYNVTKASLHRHRSLHVLADSIIDGSHIISQLALLEDCAREILRKTTSPRGKDKDYRVALRTISELRFILQDYVKALSVQRKENTVNILITPTWVLLKETIFNVLDSHPEAKHAVAKSLMMIEDPDDFNSVKSV
jgi:hypothetical protein